MKRIEAIVRPDKAGDVVKALDAVGHPGMMISEIEGYGKQHGKEEKVRGKKYRIDLITKTRIEIVLKDGDVKRIVAAIKEAAVTGEIGDGKIFIHPVDDAIRLRTGEKGDEAIY
jgi:nitrogen regulatory protein P-II 1